MSESGTFTDSSLVVGQPTLPLYKAAAVVPVSIELLFDYSGEGFQTEMQKILAQEYLSFMGNNILNATGSGQPYGVFAQMMSTTTNPAHLVATTLGDLGWWMSATSGRDCRISSEPTPTG